MKPTTSSSTSSDTAAPSIVSSEVASFKNIPGISERMLAVLDKHAYTVPTPIQSRVIPHGVLGKDIIGIAQTGTGKTLGFGIPMIERLLMDKAMKKDSRGLVILPTRELALQVDETLRKIGATAGMNLGIHTAVLIGGESMGKQVRDLRYGPDIVIATPGRLIDHLERKTITLDRVSVVVLDEADHMFDIGFMPQIKEIMKKVPKERQVMLFSATMPNEIAKLAMEHMKLPLRIEVAPQGTSSQNVEQEIIVVDRKSKFSLLGKLIAEYPGVPVLVFTRTKHGAKNIAEDLRRIGTTAAEIHSNRSLGQRKEALEGFKKHKYQVLVATDIAARGIDVKDIQLVVNYDLPEQSEDYVHRIGRTGRAGKTGKAISFATPDQKRDIMDIERLIKKQITVKSHEGATISAGSYSPRPYYGNRGGFRGGYKSGPRSAGPRRFAPAGAFKVHTNQAFKGGAPRSGGSVSSSAPARRPSRGFNSKYPRPLKTDPSKTQELGTGYRRVFRKGVR